MTHHEPVTTDRPASATPPSDAEPGVDARHLERPAGTEPGDPADRATNDVGVPASQVWRGSNAGDPAARGTPANDSDAQDTSNATEDLAARSETTEPG